VSPSNTTIRVRGARTHNLKNIDIDIPRNQLVVITGLSGSGKSSLAFDTLYAEGQRRYVESLSAYARQFLQLMDKPDVDVIEGLSPAISIEQKATSHNPRSTVGTVTEIHDHLRLLFARAGTPYCPDHDLPLAAQSTAQMVDAVLAMPEGTRLMVLAPVARARKGEFTELFTQMQAQGFVRFRINGVVLDASEVPELKKNEKHDVDVVVDRIKVQPGLQQRLAESFEAALRIAHGRAIAVEMDATEHTGRELAFSNRFACPACTYSLSELEPRLFSFNSPVGACSSCSGLGVSTLFDVDKVVAFPSLSLASGAVKGWDKRNPYTFSMLESVAKHYQFDIELPFEELPAHAQTALLRGSGADEIEFVYEAPAAGRGKARSVKRSHPFEGILPNLERRFKETDSAAVREDLARYQSLKPCADCAGSRLKREARHVYLVDAQTQRREAIYQVGHFTLSESLEYFASLKLQGAKAEIAAKVVHEIHSRLRFLNNVGLSYLSLDRGADTLSGGEAQRIRLASQIGSGLTGVMYVLDEPSIGLHQRDNERLIGTLRHLRDLGNSVIVVEHDEDAIRSADHVIDLGPGAGVHGGQIMAQGTAQEVADNPNSLTGQYLSRALKIEVPQQRRSWIPELPPAKAAVSSKAVEADDSKNIRALSIVRAKGHNLKDVTVDFPVGLFTCVTGVSGSGKSTLVNDTLYAAVAQRLYKSHTEAAPHDSIEGLEAFDKVINVDQSPIGRTPRSNPATYTGLFTAIRELFAEVPAARERAYTAGRFSFNVAGGRCEACQGDGVIKVEMHFLSDIYVPCDVCQGKRYNRETLDVLYKGKNICEVLNMTVEEAHAFFNAVPSIERKLATLLDVGLSYIRLGQNATTLSGGEAQRVKLALELSKRDTGRTLYILDEPTTGLHFADIALLLKVLHQLCEAGNTIVVIEHNLDVIKTADWLIDMGPEGGAGGGTVVAAGTPEVVAQCEASETGRYLRGYL
jgi:excinuclease ABC subunit A